MLDPLFLEIFNGTYFVLVICTVFLFLYYLRRSVGTYGYRESRAAIALTVVFIGEMIVRGTIWLSRFLMNNDIKLPGSKELSYTGLITGGAIGIVGFICVIRVYSPKNWGNVPMIIAILAVILLNGLAQLY